MRKVVVRESIEVTEGQLGKTKKSLLNTLAQNEKIKYYSNPILMWLLDIFISRRKPFYNNLTWLSR